MLLQTLLATLCVIGCTVATNSPVFLWNAATDAKPSLATVPQADFASLLKPLLKTHTIVAFLEDDLTSRDLSCQTTEAAQSCFAHLRTVSPKSYYASVESPVEALRQIAVSKEYNSIDFEGEFTHPVELSAGKVIFVNFDSISTDRSIDLESHDAAMQAAGKKLTGNVVYLYLSSSNGNQQVKRMRRSTAATKGGYIFQVDSKFLIFFSKFNYTNSEGVKTVETINSITANDVTKDVSFSVSMTAASGKTFDFMMVLENGYYNMRNVTFDGVDFRSKGLAAPTSFSYHCGNLVLSSASNAKLILADLQFQAPFNSETPAKFIFGNDWDCVPFFTPGILSGLFVMVFLLIITFVGICWMVDINTMDRFEDPKGKTITVNQAAE